MATVIKGQTYLVSFAGAAYTNLTLTSVKETKGTYNEEKIPDEEGGTDSIIDMDPYVQYDIEGVAKAEIAVVEKNGIIVFTIPGETPAETKFRCETMAVTRIPGATRVSMTIIREASMADYYDV